MKNTEEFDDLLRNKFSEETNFLFEEDKWARMEELIIAEEQKNKRRKFFFYYLSGFISALLVVMPFIFFEENEKTKSATSKMKEKQFIQNVKTKNTTKQRIVKQDLRPKNIAVPNNKNQLLILEKRNKFIRLSRNQNVKTTINSSSINQFNPTNNVDVDPKLYSLQSNSNSLDSSKLISQNIIAFSDSIHQEKKDSSNSNQINIAKNAESQLQEPVKHSLLFNFGLIYNLGISDKEGQSFSPYIGFQYLYQEKWGIGLVYQSVSNMIYDKEFISTSYDFGYRRKITTIRQVNLNYVGLPLSYHYIFNKNALSFGITPCYLIFNKSFIYENNTSVYEMDESPTKTSYGYKYGLSPIDVQLSIGYKRTLRNRLSLGLDFSYGIIDIRQSSWTDNANFENNKLFTFKLNYKIR